MNTVTRKLALVTIILMLGMLSWKSPTEIIEIEPDETITEVDYSENFIKDFNPCTFKDFSDTSKIGWIRKSEKHHIVTVTTYNAVPEQCFENPLITADGSQIDTTLLNSGKLKWCAVSRDLRKKYPYGSKIIVRYNGKEETYTVHDTMHPKWKDRIDLLYPTDKKGGKWRNVIISSI